MKYHTIVFFLLVAIVLIADCKKKSKPKSKPKVNNNKPDVNNKPSKEIKKKLNKPKDTNKNINKLSKNIKKKWNENRLKPNNGLRRAGGAKLGLFKKGGAFEMDRKHKAIRFEIFDIVETKLDNTSKTYKIEDKEFDVEKTKNDSSYGVASDMTTLNTTLENNATVRLSMLIFKENGTVTTDDGYDFDVLEGTVKFNLNLEWPYATKHIDPTLRLKCLHGQKGKKGKKAGKSKGKKKAGSKGKRPPQAYGFCEAVRVTFQSTYKSDNEWPDMPEDFPITKMSEGSGWSTVKLRLTGQNIVYDPITEVGDDVVVEVEEEKSKNSAMKGFASVFMLSFCMLSVNMLGN